MDTLRITKKRPNDIEGSPRFPILCFLALFMIIILSSGTSLAGTYYSASCSASDVNAAIARAAAGDTVMVPAGSCSWSASVYLSKAITLRGGYGGVTTITGGTLHFKSNDARFSNFTFTGGNIEVSGCTRGLIDHITLNNSSSSLEFIHVYGPDNAWSSDSTMGTAENIFIEDCIFNGGGGSSQAVQGNYNARVVFRYNTVSGMKFDMHGLWSNGSPNYYRVWTYPNIHSARHCEVYNNTFTSIYPWAMELRGGTGVVFNNSITVTGGGDGIVLREYCTAVGTDGNCARCMCPADYPLRDQIGRGKGQTLEPMYLWNNTANGKTVIGWRGSFDYWPQAIVFEGQPSSTCVSSCGSQVGYRYPGDTMSDMTAIIKENRDYYISQKPGYTSYPYPHPLQGGGYVPPSGTSLAPPQNLRVQ